MKSTWIISSSRIAVASRKKLDNGKQFVKTSKVPFEKKLASKFFCQGLKTTIF